MDIGSFCHSKQVKSEKSCKLHQLVLRKLPQGEDINIRLTEQVLSLYHFLVKSYDITKLSNREQKIKLTLTKSEDPPKQVAPLERIHKELNKILFGIFREADN